MKLQDEHVKNNFVSKCIVCGNALSDLSMNKQSMYGASITVQTCSCACRSVYYRNKDLKNLIDESILKQNFTLLNQYKIKQIIASGYKVIITK